MNQALQFFRLDGSASTLVFLSRARSTPEIIYWGPLLSKTCSLASLYQLQERPLSFASLDQEAPLSLCPEESRGFSGSPGLLMHRSGRAYGHRMTLVGTKQSNDEIVFQLEDQNSNISLEITIHLDASDDLLCASSQIQNRGPTPLSIEQLACASLPLPASFQELLLLHGRWGGEFQLERQNFSRAAAVQIDNHSGRTSHEHFPGLIAGVAGFGESQGSLIGLHLGWSGNYRIRLERLADGRSYVQASEYLLPGEIQLGAGDVYQTPKLYATWAEGLNEMSQRFHSYVRRRILPGWTRKPRPVLTNSWEAVYFDHSLPRLNQLIEAAAQAGVERFVLDDGWFRGRRHDQSGLGDWQVDPEIYPLGLGPLIESVHKHKMSFGLWVEPEMVNPNSDLFRQNPTWILQDPTYPLVTGRHQLVLNLADPNAFAYIKAALLNLLHAHPIAFLKWDMNRILVLAADQTGQAAAHRQMRAVYRLIDEILIACPNLEIEACASGGARADFEMLRRTGRIWTSDNNDPLSRLMIHRGFSLFFPPEVMGAHIGAEKAHSTGRKADPHFRALIALQGQLGFELDLSQSPLEDREIFKHYVSFYKDNRGWIQNALIFRIQCHDPALFAVSYASRDEQRS
ncbi:MAG: alpha-galactosidase, partial [Proteobacteria bacterium]|nr:alpha-galactosidase [Pseudomonadota bacterium]